MTNAGERVRAVHVVASYPPDFSGQGRQVASLLPRLASRGVELTVLTSRVGAGPDRCDERDGIRIRRFTRPAGSLGDVRFGIRVAAWVVRHRRAIDIVHLHGAEWPAVVTVPVARRLGLPTLVVLTLVGTDDPLMVRARRLGRLQYRAIGGASRFIAISSALVEIVRESTWPDDRVRAIPEGVDLDRFAPPSPAERAASRRELATSYGVDPDAPLAIFVGGVIRRKGVDVLVDAWPRVVARLPKARLLLVGPAAIQGTAEFSVTFVDQLRQRLITSGTAPSVTFVGESPDPVRFLQAADLLVLPTRNEGLPNVLLEAASAGLPVVTTNLRGITTDVVEDGVTGLLVPVDDAAALARAIVQLLEDPARAATMGRAARVAVAERFSIERVADRTVAEYHALLRQEIHPRNLR